MSSHLHHLQLKGLYFSSCNTIHSLLNDSLAMPAIQETWVLSLGREVPLEKEMAPTPMGWILARKSHGQRILEDYSPGGHKEFDTTEQITTQTYFNVVFRTGFLIFFQYRQAENFSNLQVLILFCFTISFSNNLSQHFTISSQEKQAAPSILCLEISSAKKPFSILLSSTFHKTLELKQLIQVLCHFITKSTSLSVSSNVFLISI